MADSKEGFVEKVLRSVLISSKGGVPLQKLNSEYKELLGSDIPFKDNGFKNLEAYLRSMPQVVQVKRDALGQMVCMGIANEETQHLDRLVKKQKKSKKKGKPARIPKWNARSSNRPRRPPPHNFRGNPHQNAPPPRRPEVTHQPPHNRGPPQQKRNDAPRNMPQRNDAPRNMSQRNDPPRNMPQRNDPPRNMPQRNEPPRNAAPPNNAPRKNAPQSNAPKSSNPPKGNQRRPASSQAHAQHHQYDNSSRSTYEVPPRFRRLQSTGSIEGNRDDGAWTPPPQQERSKSFDNYESAVIEPDADSWDPDKTSEADLYAPPEPERPPPVDETVVNWVNEVLSEKHGGLWMSGLKKLYQEKFHKPLEDDLVEKLGRLSLWTAEQSGVISNDKILYPKLQVEITESPSSGNIRRNVSVEESRQRPGSGSNVPSLVLPEEDVWDVYVSYITNVTDFYCILAGEEYSDQLCDMEDEMTLFYSNSRMSLGKPVVNGCYAGHLGDDWVRVKITEVNQREAVCFLVDHGDIEIIEIGDLCPLQGMFLHLPFQAIPCKLEGLERQEFNPAATEVFCKVALGQTRFAEVKRRESRISLMLYRDSLEINFLCKFGEEE